jgi:hypothetical protein
MPETPDLAVVYASPITGVFIVCFLTVRGGEPATVFVDILSMAQTTDIIKSKWPFSIVGFHKVFLRLLCGVASAPGSPITRYE